MAYNIVKDALIVRDELLDE